ncbi:hypothetical protein BFH66_004408 [Escherichia coli]|nr:hypothetical protein [Escherichia coli]
MAMTGENCSTPNAYILFTAFDIFLAFNAFNAFNAFKGGGEIEQLTDDE